jgi:hypothetical protein
VIVLLAASSLAAAQNIKPAIPWIDGRSSADDLQISLMTFSPGESVTDSWGHTALLVQDTTYKISRTYHYGFFSFDDGFINRFAMGRLIFWSADVSLNGTINRYVNAKRTIAFQELNIPSEQKLKLAQALAESVLPENSRYLYDHYKENCSTRLRDFIDTAVGGQFANSMNASGRLTFREHTLRYTANQPLLQWLLMFLMNDTIDKPIRKWDEMFLPDELAKYVAAISIKDSSGVEKKLATEPHVYYDAHKTATSFTATNKPVWVILVGLLLGLVAIGLGFWSAKGKGVARVVFLLYNSVVSLLFGLMGSVLFFMSLFTDHTVTFGNENLFLANPLALLIFFISTLLFFKKSEKLWRYLKTLWMILAASSILLLILKLLPLFDQDNIMALFILLPLNVGFAVGNFLYSKKE